jgi:hypothetical protein
MSEPRFDVLAPLRQPEYTGENRCLPCTVINLVIAAVGSTLVGLAVPVLGVAAFLVAVAVIGLRGYLVPGTPTLTARYLPESIHRALGHETPAAPEPTEVGTDIDVEAALKDADVVTECVDREDLCLTESYRAALRSEIDALESTALRRERLAASLSVDADEIEIETDEHGPTVRVGDTPAGGWESTAAFLADLANRTLLSSALSEWPTLPPADRTRLLAALRSFVEECPDCGGEVRPDEDVVRSCCRDDLVTVTTACADCGAVVFKGSGNRSA